MLYHLAELPSFIRPNNIPLYIHATFCLSFIHRYLSFFYILAIATTAPMNVGVQNLCSHFSLGVFSEMGSLDRMIMLFLIFWGPTGLVFICFEACWTPTRCVHQNSVLTGHCEHRTWRKQQGTNRHIYYEHLLCSPVVFHCFIGPHLRNPHSKVKLSSRVSGQWQQGIGAGVELSGARGPGRRPCRRRVPVAPRSPQLAVIRLFDFSHWYGCEMVSRSFNLSFHDD